MSEPTPEQIAKLPKWAQTHIDKLDRIIQRTGRLMLEAAISNGDTDTWVEHLVSEPDFGLPKGSRIKFIVDEQPIIVSVHERGYLEVYALEALTVQPHSSNVLRMKAGRWW